MDTSVTSVQRCFQDCGRAGDSHTCCQHLTKQASESAANEDMRGSIPKTGTLTAGSGSEEVVAKAASALTACSLSHSAVLTGHPYNQLHHPVHHHHHGCSGQQNSPERCNGIEMNLVGGVANTTPNTCCVGTAAASGSINGGTEIGDVTAPGGGVFTISGRRVVVAMAPPLHCKSHETNQEGKEFDRSNFSMENWDIQTQSEHYRCQCISETCSLIILILAVIVTIMTPILLIPIYAFPNENAFYFQIALWSCSGLSIVLLSIGSLVGNAFWYKDRKSSRWRCFLHYGGNPKEHFWGKYLHMKDPAKVKPAETV